MSSDAQQPGDALDDPVLRLDRRRFLRTGMAAGIAGVGVSSRAGSLLDAALKHRTHRGELTDIEHVVILMQENRSFDHYFGTLSGVQGFSKGRVLEQSVDGRRYPIFDQFGYQPGVGADPKGYLQPFHLRSDPPSENGQATNDISHNWGPQHQSWNSGAMDGFVTSHIASDGVSNGPVTMGYFTRQDLAFYYTLADAFTICDAYHCSVLGPTDPNRVMSVSATINPSGDAGGPVLETYTSDRQTHYGTFTWATMPEELDRGRNHLEGLQRSNGTLGTQPLPVFQELLPSFQRCRVGAGVAGVDPDLPGILSRRRDGRHVAGCLLDHPTARPVRAPGSSARVRREPRPRHTRDARLQPGHLEPDGSLCRL